jgi:DNA repair protein RecO (recombination protein O)
MLIHTEAIVISAIKFAEADLIVKCYTRKSGLRTYLLRGILKSGKGKFKASMFQPLTQLELVARHKDKGTMEYLQEARILHHYSSLHTNVIKSTLVLFLSEVLKSSIQEEEQNEQLYHYLENTFTWLDMNDNIANFHLLFLLNLTRYLGFFPDEVQDDRSYFNMLDGVFQDINTSPYCIEGANMLLLKRLIGTKFDELEEIHLTKIGRSNFLNMMLSYYQLHIESFKKPKSLGVLNEIFH